MDPELRYALQACVEDICRSIANRSPDLGPFMEDTVWERGTDGNFRPSSRLHPVVRLDGLEVRPSFQACAARALSDPIVEPQLNQLVGTTAAQAQITLTQIVTLLVRVMSSEDGRFEFQQDLFDEYINSLDHDLTTTTINFVTVGPLPYISTSFPVDISDNIVIDRLTDNEVSLLAKSGILRSRMLSFELIEQVDAVGIRCTEQIDKLVGGGTPATETGRFGHRTIADPTTTVGDVLTALRLLKHGGLVCPGEVSAHETILFQSGLHHRFRPTQPLARCNYELAELEAVDLRNLWSDLTSGRLEQDGFLRMALRRFNMAFDRDQLEDRIVDLMIGAESLFLHDARPATDRGELRFRLAVRAAKFVDSPRYTRRQVFDLMRKAYSVRNQVVHGQSIGNTSLPDNPDATLGELTLAVADVLRLAIRAELASPRINQPDFWTDLLFPGDEQSTDNADRDAEA